MKINRLVLASTSPYRKVLLEKAGVLVSLATPAADESLVQAPTPRELAKARSEAKGLSLPERESGFVAISADQVLEFNGESFGKAADRETAKSRLGEMQGKSHLLHSAYSLVLYRGDGEAPTLLGSRIVTAKMTMRKLSEGEIDAYLDTGEWQGCAGSYQFEHRGLHLFSEVQGDLDTIVGLPLMPLLEDLRTLGINVLIAPIGPWTLRC